uniref:Uncharacterized protein n=1 Tax=Romanomermis culicivorax TaxID=13658 RepID=A0A915KQ13_ROMCU
MQVCYDQRFDAYALYPIPLRMKNDKSVLVLTQNDVEKNMKIHVERQKPTFTCQSYNDSLILTKSTIKQDLEDEFSLIFIDYFPQSSNLLDNRNRDLFDSIVFEFEDEKKHETATVKEFMEKSKPGNNNIIDSDNAEAPIF